MNRQKIPRRPDGEFPPREVKKFREESREAYAGTAEFQEYFSKSGSKREFGESRATFRQRVQEIQSKMESCFEIREQFRELVDAGASRECLLHGVALLVALQETRRKRGHWLQEMRRHKRTLKSLVTRLRGIAREVKTLYSLSQSHPDLWDIALQRPHNGNVIPENRRVPEEWVSETMGIADELAAKARGLGMIGKREPPRFHRGPLPDLLKHILSSATPDGVDPLSEITSALRPRLETLSEIIAGAYVLMGIPEKSAPSAEALRVMLTRHVLPRT